MMALALVLALALPHVGYLALLVLLLADPIQARLNKRWRAVAP